MGHMYGAAIKKSGRRIIVSVAANIVVIAAICGCASWLGDMWYALLAAPFVVFMARRLLMLRRNARNQERLGCITSPELAEMNLAREFIGDDIMTRGHLTMTPGWIFSETTGDTYLMPASKLVWIYKTWKKTKTARGHKVTFCFADGRSSSFMTTLGDAGDIIEYVACHYKSAYIGSTPEYHKQWNRHRDDFIAKWRHENIKRQSERSMIT